MAKKEKKSQEEMYQLCVEAGPSELLAEKGTDGKRFARWAFDGTYQPQGPYEADTEDKLRGVVDALLQIARKAFGESGSFGAALVQTAKAASQGLHTHSGKYVHGDSRTLYMELAGHERYAYLSTASALGMRSVTAGFSHKQKATRPGKLFIANLRVENRITSIAELIIAGNSVVRQALTEAGVSDAEYELIVSELSRALLNKQSNTADYCLPLLLWPTDSGDVGLTPIPGLPVYNAISSLRGRVADECYLPMTSFRVGSGKAQNVSAAASSLAGNFPLLKCEPPSVRKTDNSKRIQRFYSNALALKLTPEQLQWFSTDVHAWPNERRKAFFRRNAAVHVTQVLKDAIELRKAKPERVQGSSALAQFVAGEPLNDALAEALTAVVLENGPSECCEEHSASDIKMYYEFLFSELMELDA